MRQRPRFDDRERPAVRATSWLRSSASPLGRWECSHFQRKEHLKKAHNTCNETMSSVV